MFGGSALLSGEFLPSDLAGVVGWWDPTDLAFLTQSGGFLTSITDRIQGVVLTPSGSNVVGRSADALLNSQQVMTFNTAGYLSSAVQGTGYPASTADDVSILFAARLVSTGSGFASCVMAFGASPDWGVGVAGALATSNPAPNDFQSVSIGSFKAYGTPAATGAAVHAWRANASGHEFRKNGTAQTFTANSAFPGFGAGGMRLGARMSGSEILRGSVGDVIVGKGLTSVERDQIEGYLAWKYGLAASLPPGHPFK